MMLQLQMFMNTFIRKKQTSLLFNTPDIVQNHTGAKNLYENTSVA